MADGEESVASNWNWLCVQSISKGQGSNEFWRFRTPNVPTPLVYFLNVNPNPHHTLTNVTIP